MKYPLAAALAAMLSAPVAAQDHAGDTEAGARQFDRNCAVCHVVQTPDGETLAGSKGRTGPNLFGVIGSQPGSQPEFSYSPSLVAYGESGVTWGPENTVAFVQDPTAHLREALGSPSARSKMVYRSRDEEQVRDIVAFLATFPRDEQAKGSPEGAEAAPTVDVAAGTTAAEALVEEPPHDMAAGGTLYAGTCRNCHGPKAQGLASFPRLADQEADFLKGRLEQYRAGEKVGPNSALMFPIARELSDADIANVAAFIAAID